MKYRVIMMMAVAVFALTATAQNANPFQSTSSLMESGSRYQSAAVTGTYTSDSWSPAEISGGRRAAMDGEVNPLGDKSIEDVENPNEPGENVPVGNGVWVLLLLAGSYLGRKKLLRKAHSGKVF